MGLRDKALAPLLVTEDLMGAWLKVAIQAASAKLLHLCMMLLQINTSAQALHAVKRHLKEAKMGLGSPCGM